jgi:hypothetical protein
LIVIDPGRAPAHNFGDIMHLRVSIDVLKVNAGFLRQVSEPDDDAFLTDTWLFCRRAWGFFNSRAIAGGRTMPFHQAECRDGPKKQNDRKADQITHDFVETFRMSEEVPVLRGPPRIGLLLFQSEVGPDDFVTCACSQLSPSDQVNVIANKTYRSIGETDIDTIGMLAARCEV